MAWVRKYRRKNSIADSVISKMKKRDHIISSKAAELSESFVAPKDQEFILANGESISSIGQLSLLLDSMEDQIYSQHVNSEKNDFAAWIRDVFNENHLADHFESCENKHEAQIALLKHTILKH